MNVTLINTMDNYGGAAKAAVRLHLALRAEGEDSRMVVRHRRGGVPHTTAVALDRASDKAYPELVFGQCIQRHLIDENRAHGANTYFSFPHPGLEVSGLNVIQRADCINLHWVERFLSPVSLRRLFSLGKPVIWTLHDQAPFTGGCHYTMGCGGFRSGCSKCPQVAEDPWGLTAAVFRDKADAYQGANLTLITPSRWMAGQAGQSALLGGLRIEVIPNSLDIDVFKPMPKPEARKALNLPPAGLCLLLGSYDLRELRKGTRQCVEALQHCLQDPGFQDRCRAGDIRLLTFGYPHSDLESIGIPVHALGYLESEASLAAAYAAADLFVLPSLEDNLPNTILEAMSCGTVIAAFDAGGIPEMVEEGVTGRLARTGDAVHLAKIIVQLLDSDDRQTMGRACRERVERDYAPHVQAGKYLDLFRELVGDVSDGVAGHGLHAGINAFQESEDADTLLTPLTAVSGPGIDPIYEELLLPALKKASLRLPALEEKELILVDRDRTIKDLQHYINEQQRHIDEQQRYIDEQQRGINDLQRGINDLRRGIEELPCYVDDQQLRIEDLPRYIDDQQRRIKDQQRYIDDQQRYIDDQQRHVKECEAHIESIHEDGLGWLLTTGTRPQRSYAFLHDAVPGMITTVIEACDAVAGLERSIRSVWAQDMAAEDMELLVCDNRSSDGTYDLAMSLAGQSPVPMQVISFPDRGDAAAMRDLGISHSRGEFVALLRAGDAWRPERLSTQLQYLNDHPDVVCVCGPVTEWTLEGQSVRTRGGHYTLDSGGEHHFSPPYTFDQFLHGNPIEESTLLIRRSALVDVGPSPPNLAYPTGAWLELAKLSLIHPIDSLEKPLVDVILPEGAIGKWFPPERAYGEDLEFLCHLVHWMLQHPRHRDMGVRVYQEQYPRLMNLRGNAYRLIEEFYRYYGPDGEPHEFKEYFNAISTELVNLRRWVQRVKGMARFIPGLEWTAKRIMSSGRPWARR